MATNLLLEGDDLEALLIKAHSEGGPDARIVRADKFRHGGVWGFFARERFEVAVEIPAPPPGGSVPGASVGHRHLQPAARRARRTDQVEPAVPLPPPASQPSHPAAHPAATSQATGSYREAGASRGPAETGLPTPAELAADGLLGIADRVSAAERAAARAVQVMLDAPHDSSLSRSTPATSAERTSSPITLPGADQVRAFASTMTLTRPTNGTVSSQMKRPARTPAQPAAAPLEQQTPAALEAIMAMAAAELGEAPHEPGLSPVRPSTSRPEFTALLDQLREGSRPPRQRSPRLPDRARAYLDDSLGAGAGVSKPAPAPDALTSRLDATTLDSSTLDSSTLDSSMVELGVEPPIERAAPPALRIPAPGLAAPGRAVPAPAAPAAGPAPGVPTQAATPAPATTPSGAPAAEQDDDDETPTNRQTDPRTTADRRTLRALGVPPAWTRRLRTGDRFAEVLRMLERMPDSDIDPDATVVAVVGPAGGVQLEAHRTAIDLATDAGPRPVVVVPATVGTERATAVARALRSGPVVLAVESAGDDAGLVLDTLTTVQAGAVIAVVDAAAPLERTQRWLDALGQVDALVLDGATTVPDPAAVLQLGLPVVRLDGVPVDRVTWTALLCAQLMAAQARQAR